MPAFTFPRFLLVLVLALLLWLAPLARAQVLPEGVRLGMSAVQLREAEPRLEPVLHPQVVAGAAGRWRLPRVAQAGRLFEETFFLSADAVQRVELLLRAPAPGESEADAYAALVLSLSAAWGPALASRSESGGQVLDTASWERDGFNVMVLRSGPAQDARVRVVYRLREERDASQL